MFSLDGLFKALAAVATLAFALIVLAGRGRPAARGYLAAFLLLVAANQGIEAWRTLIVDPSLRLTLARAAAVAAALDPAALALFAAATARAPGVDRWALPLAAFGGAVAIWGGWSLADDAVYGSDRIYHLVLLAYTACTYTAVLLWAARNAERPGSPRWWRPLLFGVAVLALPTWLRVSGSLVGVVVRPRFPEGGEPLGYWMVQVAAALLIATFGAYAAGRWARRAGATPNVARAMRVFAAVGLVAVLAHELATLAWLAGAIPWTDLTVVGRSGAPVRWLLFGAALSLAVLRDEAITFSPAARRHAARALAALAGLVLVALAFTALSAVTQSDLDALPPIAWIALAAALALSQGFRSAVERLASRLAPDATPQHGARLAGLATGGLVAGRYRIEALLGRGGGGRAFLARDETLRRRVVLKEVLGATADDVPLREARLAGNVQHPNVLTVHDVLVGDDRAIIVTEHAARGSLADALSKGALDHGEALRVLCEALDGLAAVHDAGIVHRDIKPANVLLTAEGRAKVGDFGIAAFDAGRTDHLVPAVAGTPGFAAPEQRAGRPATKASDVYAMGRLMTELLGHALPPHLAAIAAKATDEEPSRRYADARAMRDALQLPAPHAR